MSEATTRPVEDLALHEGPAPPARYRGEAPGLTQRIENYRLRAAVVENAHLARGGAIPDDALGLVSSDALRLGGHPHLIDAQVRTLRGDGPHAPTSLVFLGEDSPQRRFEARIADFVGMEGAVLCQSGWTANVGLLQTIAERGTPVYIDLHAHASLWEGIQVAGADPHPFRHNNIRSLARRIRNHGPGIVIVDAVYSATGSVCPLADVTRLCRDTGCILVVDESHSMGLHGNRGNGLVAEKGLLGEVDYITFSLAKTFVSRGGVVMGPDRVMEFFRFESRQAIFSAAAPLPHDIAGMGAALDLVENDTWRRQRVTQSAAWLRRELGVLGFDTAISQTKIVPLVAGSDLEVLRLLVALEQRGLFGLPFVSPATPVDKGLIRLTVHCDLLAADLERVVDICREARAELGWPLPFAGTQAAAG